MNITKKETFRYGEMLVTLETGMIAKQADAAVMVSMGQTVVLVTLVAAKTFDETKDFLPLTVHYQERSYAAGVIPGGYFKREGRPSEQEILISRLIDRPLRPLFPKNFTNDVQIIATVLSADPEIPADIPAMLGASAALRLSGLPCLGPLGAARVGFIDGAYVLNPTQTQLTQSKLDLVMAGTKDAVFMVESAAKELSETEMLEAVTFGQTQSQLAIEAIERLCAAFGSAGFHNASAWELPAEKYDLNFEKELASFITEPLTAAYALAEKVARKKQISQLLDQAIEKFAAIAEDDLRPTFDVVTNVFKKIEKALVRQKILAGEPRIDGRDTRTVRPISIDLSLLPRTHGSVVFTRGETQALLVTTLGSARDQQSSETLYGEKKESFMLHYNFPPYSVGELGQVGSPKRREIGHGNLAKRAILPVLPESTVFPYTIRVVSEITESNGSSSMATVCGGSLSLMDAGVPIKAPVAGIAMGLVKDGDRFAVLTDILGDEDHLGDMDFKVAGTANGVTALQMDIKITGITHEIMSVALEQAKEARLHILNIMNTALPEPRTDVSSYAPRLISFAIPSDKIRDVIGKGGSTIRGLMEETGATIDVNDAGQISIAAPDAESAEKAKTRVNQLIADVEVGEIYEGKVTKIVDFGAFVAVLPGKEGLLHISQITDERVNNVSDWLSEGQSVRVKVLEIDRQGRLRLSMKVLTAASE